MIFIYAHGYSNVHNWINNNSMADKIQIQSKTVITEIGLIFENVVALALAAMSGQCYCHFTPNCAVVTATTTESFVLKSLNYKTEYFSNIGKRTSYIVYCLDIETKLNEWEKQQQLRMHNLTISKTCIDKNSNNKYFGKTKGYIL